MKILILALIMINSSLAFSDDRRLEDIKDGDVIALT